MDLITCKCGCQDMRFKDIGPHTGAYCEKCGDWVKWVSKKTPTTLDGINPNYHNMDMDDIYGNHEQKEPSPYDGDYYEENDLPWED